MVLGCKPRFSIFDLTDCYGIISNLSGSTDKVTIRRLQTLISSLKSALISPDAALANVENETE